MAVDLKSMSSKELEKLMGDVKKALQTAKARDRRQALKAAEKAAGEWGFSLNDLAAGEKPVKKQRKGKAKVVKAKSKPQYANPSDKSQTWTGKGRQPNWFRAAVAKGKSPDDLRI